MKHRALILLMRSVLWRIVLLWCRTLRITRVGAGPADALRASGRNYVAAFWHGTMFTGWYLLRPVGGERMSALVSQSKDGAYLSAMLERWGFTMIRGSSHIGGKEAMQLMTAAVSGGSSLAITPDGPRGPKREMKMGAVRTAQKCGVPLLLIGIAAERQRVMGSWDAFELPMPFSRVTAVYSEPVTVPAELDGPPLDEFRKRMQERLNELTAAAEAGV
ncbi:MAG: lysophospholipid acyltransferase family protein [Bacteroidetes bacterium]|nr:MAG: lysophospholipid acyltransferase family protein [Bacteroidota bacterium]